MWTPTKISAREFPRWKAGWYCHDNNGPVTDPSRRYSSKQAAQNACDRLNGAESAKENDGKIRNPKKWFTIGYVDRMSTLISNAVYVNPIHYHGYLSELLHQTAETMRNENIPGAFVAVIWPGQLSRQTALFSAGAIPIRHVFADGRITGRTA
jgi:hypothetical protein